MVRPQIYEWKSRFQEGRKTANILNKQSHKAQKTGPLLLGPEEGALTFQFKKTNILRNITQRLETGMFL
jgi:hypothetical protein